MIREKQQSMRRIEGRTAAFKNSRKASPAICAPSEEDDEKAKSAQTNEQRGRTQQTNPKRFHWTNGDKPAPVSARTSAPKFAVFGALPLETKTTTRDGTRI